MADGLKLYSVLKSIMSDTQGELEILFMCCCDLCHHIDPYGINHFMSEGNCFWCSMIFIHFVPDDDQVMPPATWSITNLWCHPVCLIEFYNFSKTAMQLCSDQVIKQSDVLIYNSCMVKILFFFFKSEFFSEFSSDKIHKVKWRQVNLIKTMSVTVHTQEKLPQQEQTMSRTKLV